MNTLPSKAILKIEEEVILSKSFYKASTTLIPKSDKNTTTKLQPTVLKNIDVKILNKILAKQIQPHIEESYIIIK